MQRPLRTVALVGVDGSGKTTQARRLAAALTAEGLPAAYRQNAGGRRWFGRLAEAHGRRDAEDLLGSRTMLVVESLLRWLAIFRTVVRRALTGEIAVMDRHAVCQYVRAGGAGPRAVRRVRRAFRPFPRPDVTFLLVVDPRTAYDRIESRGYDHEEMAYLTATNDAYRALPEAGTFVVIDANRSEDEIAATIRAALRTPAAEPRAFPLLRRVALAAAPVLTGASVLTQQLAEAF